MAEPMMGPEEALVLADRLSVPFAMVDPRPIQGDEASQRGVLRVQAKAFAWWLTQRGFSAVEVTTVGEVCVAGSAPFTVADMRAALVKDGPGGLLLLVAERVVAARPMCGAAPRGGRPTTS